MAHIALTIAGSDSGGGAGIQADLKTMSALGVYGASVITAVTAQNTRAVSAVHAIPHYVIAAQIGAVLSDLDVRAIKIGMLATREIIDCVTRAIAGFSGAIVLDPVMIAKSGDALLAPDAISALRETLLPRATLVTPNLPEAAALLAAPEAKTSEEMIDQGKALCAAGAKAVLMKGGHAESDLCEDLLISGGEVRARFSAHRQYTRNTHGTGCTLSSALAAGLAKGMRLEEAAAEAHRYVQKAIAAADTLDIGQGRGPLHHFHHFWG
ncbi:bifunctional hydroxymethylpyrimidine kinase/phosphomethylpyrimidine kinase [Alloyangia pacifica]|uniref:hydroxymethylpyrimidine kinase n=1 Tax=Alloyangia pacifica TaxID=311180 RepID=A0A1I6VVL6_9RHOB|nr:bifunctional hydroxymethylpyrimidine kinase/phosphomethylpyrimidine kinase [Alloyangia pacifica]SDI23850.1 hydroxymethylpyrimidine kinase /phosphomethylpyrimidine kinase [Alloyangia pacifica]SFT17753.1 hydroxymethylpyrimidine kinase /phosphomethylpyrimidine kinase [Alloyangia pacifica]